MKFWCNNQTVVHVVNKLTSHSYLVMQFEFSFCSFLFVTEPMPGVNNDVLSCFQEHWFRKLAPDANLELEAMPQALWNLGRVKSYGQLKCP